MNSVVLPKGSISVLFLLYRKSLGVVNSSIVIYRSYNEHKDNYDIMIIFPTNFNNSEMLYMTLQF